MFQLEGANVGAAYTMRPEQCSQGVPPNWMLYIATTSADESVRRGRALGGTVLCPAFDVLEFGRMAVIQDPTRAVFAVWEAKKHQGLELAGVPNTFSWADLSTNDVDTAKGFYE
jgi:uncharacterized protein